MNRLSTRRLDRALKSGRDDDVLDRARLRAGDLHELAADQPASVVEDHVEAGARAALGARAEHEHGRQRSAAASVAMISARRLISGCPPGCRACPSWPARRASSRGSSGRPPDGPPPPGQGASRPDAASAERTELPGQRPEQAEESGQRRTAGGLHGQLGFQIVPVGVVGSTACAADAAEEPGDDVRGVGRRCRRGSG